MSKAYAQHIQIATDENGNEVEMQELGGRESGRRTVE